MEKTSRKKDGCLSPEDMRPISILNVEGRIFFSLVEKRMSAYSTLNGYIKTWEQKAFMVEVTGCIEHSTLIFEALKEAKEEYRSICLAMLDFANAYGSIRHNCNLIHFAMEWYHFPPWLCKLIFCYYDKILVTKNWSTDFFCLANWTSSRMLHLSDEIQYCFANFARLP